MYLDGDVRATIECWDRVFNALEAGPRRHIILSLLNAPEERRLPLPDAATASATPRDSERFAIELQHLHLPKLTEGGYVRWSDDPFCVQRGPRFEEPAAVVRSLLASRDQLPASLWNESMEREMLER